MKKRILCLVLALALVGAAVGFFVYGKVGNTFDYAKKDMSKYVNIESIEFVRSLYTGATSPESVTPEEIRYAVAEALAAVAEEVDVGVIAEYDTLYVKYYATIDEDGTVKVVSKTSALDPEVNTTVQLGTDSDLARLFEEFLLGQDLSGTSYRAFVEKAVLKGDKINYDYTVDGVTTSNQTATIKGADFLEEVAEGLTARFLEALSSEDGIEIGTAVELVLGEGDDAKTYALTVNYALRDKITGGDVLDGDTVNFIYREVTQDDEGNDVEGEDEPYSAVLSDALDATFGTGFYEAVKALTIGTESEAITTTVTGEDDEVTTKTYYVTVEYVEGREDTSMLAEEDLEKAEVYFNFEKIYDADATVSAENDEELSLAGKTVTYHVVVTNVKHADYDYDAIIDDLEFTPDEDSEVEAFFAAYDAFVAAQEAYTDAQRAYDKAKEAYDDAQQAYDEAAALEGEDAKTEEELEALLAAVTEAETPLNEAQAALTDAENKLDEAETALYEAEEAYLESLDAEAGSFLAAYADAYKTFVEAKKAYDEAAALEGEDAKTEEELAILETAVTEAETALHEAEAAYLSSENASDLTRVDVAARKAYEKSLEEALQDEKDTEFSYAVAKEVWDALLAAVESTVEYPSKAVRVAYRGIIDELKTEYYENRDTAPYSDYSTFKSYLKQSVYAGKDYKAEITAEAEQVVLEKLVLYRLVELYGTTLTSSQEYMVSFYQLYMESNYCDEVRAAYLFDNTMQKIAEQVCPSLADAD